MNIALIEILARVNPYMWEIIHPHVPLTYVGGVVDGMSEVELNPQPIPPGHELTVAGVGLARMVAEGAVLTHAQSERGPQLLAKVVDDWCGTKGQHPWPPGWPHGSALNPSSWRQGPDPLPWKVAEMFAAASVVFARFSGGLQDGALREAFREGAEKLGARAVASIQEER